MMRFWEVFKNRPAILPVIHVESSGQTLRNAEIARSAGCDGVFLINHAGSYRDLLAITQDVKVEFPGWWTGVNCLDLTPARVFAAVSQEVNGVWVDNAMIDELSGRQDEAERITRARIESGWRGLYFGGVAFKYQRPVVDLERAAALATRYMDIVTTSGSGTGLAAHVDKIRTMKKAIGDFPLAIASGITPENAQLYVDVADCFLVATGISSLWSQLDPGRVKELVSRVRNGRAMGQDKSKEVA